MNTGPFRGRLADWALANRIDLTVIGPDDPHPAVDSEALRLLPRDIFRAAGGSHDDWEAYDRVMAQQRRAAVLVTARRVYTNPQTPQ